MEWKEVRLGDVIDYKKGFAFKSSMYKSTGTYIVRVSDTTANSVDVSLCNCISPELAHQYTDYSLKTKDIIIATVGSWPTNPASIVGKVVRVPESANNALLNQNAVRIRSNGIVDSDYLYYLLKEEHFSKYLVGTAQGSANQASITLKDIFGYSFSAPSEIKDQHRIASILSSLDRKIELNNKINADLEEMAQAIFKNWFVDFEPFKGGKFVDSELGMIPEGWKVGRADDFYQINIGKTPPRKENKWFSTNPADKIWVSIANMGNSGIFISDSSEYLTKEAVDWHNIIMVPRNTILLSFKLTVGRVAIADKELTTNEAIARFILSDDKYMEYLYLYLKNFDYNSLGSTSSIATAVNSKTIKGMQMLQPSDKIIDAFHIQVNPIFEKIRSLTKENSRLSLLRDTLLPRLMSGELEVPE